MGRPRKIVVQKYLTDKETAELEGKWIDEFGGYFEKEDKIIGRI